MVININANDTGIVNIKLRVNPIRLLKLLTMFILLSYSSLVSPLYLIAFNLLFPHIIFFDITTNSNISNM